MQKLNPYIIAECPSRRATEWLVWNYCTKKIQQSQGDEKWAAFFMVNRHKRGQNRKLVVLLKKSISSPHKGAYLSLPLKCFVVLPFVQKKRIRLIEEICSTRGFLFEKNKKNYGRKHSSLRLLHQGLDIRRDSLKQGHWHNPSKFSSLKFFKKSKVK